MSTAIQITATTNANQTGVIIEEVSGVSRLSMTNIILYFYYGADLTLFDAYTLTSEEEADFVDLGSIELSFTDMFGATEGVLADDWWTIEMRATSDEYISNQYGFGIFVDLAFATYSLINSVHVPENSKNKSQDLFWKALVLDGMKYLDTSSVNDRGVKFVKRKETLEKLLGV